MRADEEIYVCYGEYSNLQLLDFYGFTLAPDENPQDAYTLDVKGWPLEVFVGGFSWADLANLRVEIAIQCASATKSKVNEKEIRDIARRGGALGAEAESRTFAAVRGRRRGVAEFPNHRAERRRSVRRTHDESIREHETGDNVASLREENSAEGVQMGGREVRRGGCRTSCWCCVEHLPRPRSPSEIVMPTYLRFMTRRHSHYRALDCVSLTKRNKRSVVDARASSPRGEPRARPSAFSAHASAVRRARASGATKDNARIFRTQRYLRVDARETLRIESQRRRDPRGNPAARPRIVY